MKVYHGTSRSAAEVALKSGLRPRGKSKGNWESCPSRSDLVYLTTAYAAYFALAASKPGEDWAILEVDTDLLDEDLLLPDEDFLEQATRDNKAFADSWADVGYSPDGTMHERTAWFRERLEFFQACTEESVDGIGNCACCGGVLPEAITRAVAYSGFDRETSNPTITTLAVDPQITIMNYKFVGNKYRSLTSWFFGDGYDWKVMLGYSFMPEPLVGVDVDGIKNALAQRDGLTWLKGGTS